MERTGNKKKQKMARIRSKKKNACSPIPSTDYRKVILRSSHVLSTSGPEHVFEACSIRGICIGQHRV